MKNEVCLYLFIFLHKFLNNFWRKLKSKKNFYTNQCIDSRLDDWPLMGSPLPVFGIIIAYYYTATWIGPKLMKNRKALQIKNVITVYNFLQIIWNSYVAYFVRKL